MPASQPNLIPHEQLKSAFEQDNVPLFRQLLEQHPEFKARLNDRVGPFDSPAILHVRSRAMLDLLLEAGADLNAKSGWWAGGFGLLHLASPELAAYAIERGAIVDVHAAARLGLLDPLRTMISAQPDLVQARGGDGQTPLHFASTVAIAEFLLQHGAAIEARDVDHESTPAQYMVRDRQPVARHLVQRGAQTDIFLATALGDEALVRQHLAADPACVAWRVSDEFFPKLNPKAGGTIYQWTLGWHVSPLQVARDFGHENIFQLLWQHSAPEVKFMAAGWSGDEEMIRSLLSESPNLSQSLSETDRRQVAHAARNNNTRAVRAMLAAGLPVDARGQHGATPLHWAAFHGNDEMAREILRYHPPLENTDADFQGTPLGWAVHGSVHGWYCRSGNYVATVEALLRAGARREACKPGGTEAVQELLSRR